MPVKERWRDNRHTRLITGLAEGGASDETIRDIAEHVSKQMLAILTHPARTRNGGHSKGACRRRSATAEHSENHPIGQVGEFNLWRPRT
jgi:tripartite-type tricarboxylate transporter receptor subunit TctC